MIYFDNAASTPSLKEVEETYIKVNEEFFANSDSRHEFGRQSASLLEKARESILRDLGVEKTHSLIFTSGATESNNLALKGVALRYRKRGKKIISTAIEHPSVSHVLDELRELGFTTVLLKPTSNGNVDPSELEKAIDSDTILVSVMGANNETGAINDIASMAKIVKRYPKCFFHVDATQSIMKSEQDLSVSDLFSLSAHKLGGMKGSGALVYRKGMSFFPVNAGGEQERGFRGGTSNLPGDVSLAKAISIDKSQQEEIVKNVSLLRGYLYSELVKRDDIVMNSPLDGSPFILNFSLKKKKASVVLEALSERGIYVSSVSACSSAGEPISSVLLAMGRSVDLAKNSMRVSFGRQNTMGEAKEFLSAFESIMQEVIDR